MLHVTCAPVTCAAKQTGKGVFLPGRTVGVFLRVEKESRRHFWNGGPTGRGEAGKCGKADLEREASPELGRSITWLGLGWSAWPHRAVLAPLPKD
jgi:hypothetical protein